MKKQAKGSKAIFYNRFMRGSRVLYSYPTEPRPVAWFVEEIRKAIEKAPADPVRIEILETEMESASEAFYSLGDGFRMTTAMHIDPTLKSYDVLRMAEFGPGYPKPEPVKTLACSNQVDAKKAVERMRAKYGPEFNVESYSRASRSMTRGRWECRVWRGEDWLRLQQGQWTAVEIAEYLRLNTGLAEHYRPQAEARRKHSEICRDAQRKSWETRREEKEEEKQFILDEWKKLEPQVEAKELRTRGEEDSAYAIIRDRFEYHHGKRISESKIDRARGLKK